MIGTPSFGSALATTSGIPRPNLPSSRGGTDTADCQSGRGNFSLTPPPVAISPLGVSLKTVSDVMRPASDFSVVPPTDRTQGLDPGKSTCRRPSFTPSVTPP